MKKTRFNFSVKYSLPSKYQRKTHQTLARVDPKLKNHNLYALVWKLTAWYLCARFHNKR